MFLDQDLPVPSDMRYSSFRVGIRNTEELTNWLSRGFHATMSYLSRGDRLRKQEDTSLLVQNSRSVIVFLLNYRRRAHVAQGYGRIASYATFEDYHSFFLNKINDFMCENGLYSNTFKSYVDTGPLSERSLAKSSSLGWIGKNSMLINRDLGSFTFLGSAVTDIALDSPSLPSPDLCGSCTRCIESCPTGAINNNRTVDSNLCISYHTIESRSAIPKEISESMGDMIFGCDVCNDVCPWNQGKKESLISEVQRDQYSERMKLEDIAFIDKETFDLNYRRSAIRRVRFDGLARNALVALYNAGKEDVVREAGRQFDDIRSDQASILLK